MNQQSKIIIFVVSLFVVSSVFLFSVNNKYLNSNYQTTWWSAYFENPKGEKLNFVIENHSDKSDFEYRVLSGEDILKSENVSVAKGEIKNIRLNLENLDKKTTIRIFSGDEKREIYKNFEK
jgi:hypothetical protein